jgi:integrase
MTRRFRSFLAQDIEGFLAFKRSLGHSYVGPERMLRFFDRFVHDRWRGHHRPPLDEILSAWVQRNRSRKPTTISAEYSLVRRLCLYRQRQDPRAFVPSKREGPSAKGPRFMPYVLDATQVRSLIREADKLDRPRFRSRVYRALLLVLYCTGLRFGEALRLRVRDVDLERSVFFIAPSKGRARWVPFDQSLVRELRLYLAARREYARTQANDFFFVGHDRRRLPDSTAGNTVRALLRATGLKPAAGRIGPRPYDLRSTFAVHRLTLWYRSAIDIDARLPWLSAYMGHDNLLGTEKYLLATPPLLRLAARRLRERLSTTRSWP